MDTDSFIVCVNVMLIVCDIFVNTAKDVEI